MASERHQRIKEIFLEVCELPPESRGEFIDRTCGGDAGLRAEVEGLLAQDARPSPLEALSVPRELACLGLGADPEPRKEPVPETVGNYRLLRKLGEGGMGVVYEAEQKSPRRTVALKVIQKGLISRAQEHRFRREAEILGRLQHPGIAQIHEAGISESGQSFFAMELVVGSPLLEYAESHSLGAEDRLALFAKVCDAVHHAHQRGVIHRDLKPSNILVDASGQPKVLDFGIARAAEAELQAATLHAGTGQILGTVPYMSPEQASADPEALDPRSDVYSLGVILYELLSGRLPYEVHSKPLHEALRVIREDNPSRLGTTSVAFRGDIETIAGKSLEKEKARRYPSAEVLAADIRRYLRNEPITARPASAVYQLNRLPLARGQNSPAARNGAGERSSRDFVTAPAEIE